MRLGLLGAGIQHSLSPALYREFLGSKLVSYELFDLPAPGSVPSLEDFAQKLDGLSITTPYKTHYLSQVEYVDPEIEKLGAINCISFSDQFLATNTDYLALKDLLPETISTYAGYEIVLLGDGVMAKITKLILKNLNVHYRHFSRKTHGPLEKIDLKSQLPKPLLVINACARSYVFAGQVPASSVFWDYNYSFRSHSETLPRFFKTYIDGEELLRRQALSAISFWRQTNPKLKC